MPWVLNAAFRIIKSWLPEKAVEKIKFLGKKDISTYVPIEDALKSWGGQNPYTFNFVPEAKNESSPSPIQNNNTNKKVHFIDALSMSENSNISEKEYDGGALKVRPSGIITFIREGNELISTVEVQNSDTSTCVSFKLKTTSPEKFRVKPSTGCLAPGASASITITLLEGFQLGGLSRDKFLVLSTPIDSATLSQNELADLWKTTSNKKISEVRLRCVQSGEQQTRNGAIAAPPGGDQGDQLKKLSANVAQLNNSQVELQKAIKQTQYYQIATILLFLLIGIGFGYFLRNELGEISANHSVEFCRKPDADLQ